VFVQPVEGMTLVGKPRALTFDDSAAGVEWTSDSRSLVFGRGDGLWRIGGDGAQPQLVYAGTGLITPSVARHGDRLVFQHVATDANIWRVASPTSGDTTSQAPAKIIASTHTDRSPNISHDGRKVAFTSNRSGVSEIWVSNIDGSEPVQVTHAGGRSVGSPRWSPDGERIAFDSMQSGSYQIDIVSAHGGDMHAVTHGPANNSRPSWSTEGRWIYFASTQSGTEQIWKIRSDGSGNAVQLTKNGGVEPIASFDGTYVYYAKVRRTPGIWRIPVDGGDEEHVLNRGIEGSWGLTRQGIVLMDKIARPQAAIELYGYDAALLRRMLLPPGLRFDLANPSFSVAPDGSWIVYTQLDSWGSDIEMIDRFR
jgi:Tol biopolymer transport system component